MGHAVHLEKCGLPRTDAIRERSPCCVVPQTAQQQRHRPKGPWRVTPEKFACGCQREAVAVILNEHTYLSKGAHEAVERGRVHSHGSRDLLCCLGTAHELLGQAQLRGGGQCLCDELAGDEMHKHRRWRHSVVHCVLLSWVSDSHEKFGGSAGASLDYKVYDVVASTSKDAELALKDNQDRIRDTILPKGGNNDNNAACLGGRQL